MKNLICLFLSLCVLTNIAFVALAAESETGASSKSDFLIELSHTPTLIDDKFTPSENAVAKAQVTAELKRLGLLFLSTGNHLSISAEAWNMIDDIPSLNLLANDYVFANEAIDDGILRVDSSTLELYNCDVTEKTCSK